MWTWLGTLPIWGQVALPVALMVTVLFISIYGNTAIEWGKKRIGLGKGKSGSNSRSCKDCVLLILGRKARHSLEAERVTNSILRDQMNFVEEKIQEVTFRYIDSYNAQVKASGSTNHADNDKEITLYAEAFKNSLAVIKDELRRSFKENGFHKLVAREFTEYTKDKTNSLISMIKNYLIDRYPHQGMIVTLSERFTETDKDLSYLQNLIHEIFTKAQDIRVEANLNIKSMDDAFAGDIDTIVTNKES